MIAEDAPLAQCSSFKIREAGWGFFYVALRQPALWFLSLYLAAGMASASAQTGTSAPTEETIVARMAQARADNRARFRPYIVTRNYKLFGEKGSKARSEVIADIAFVPPGSKEYSIQETSGSGLGQMIVRRMLASEAEVTRNYVSTDISADNYGFRFIREGDVNGQRCYVLELFPRRKEKHLLHGFIWVDASTYLLRRFEGELAKAPSWWVRNVSVTLTYGDVRGMWLQTASEAVATVWILGRSTMISHDVKYKITEIVAAASPAQTSFVISTPGRSLHHRAIPKLPK
jgi:hypothetical protein